MPIYDCDMGDPLDMLAEECAEVVQALMKIRRFGHTPLYFNPETGRSSRDGLVQEVGDVLAVIDILTSRGDLLAAELEAAKRRKFKQLKDYFGYRHRAGDAQP